MKGTAPIPSLMEVRQPLFLEEIFMFLRNNLLILVIFSCSTFSAFSAEIESVEKFPEILDQLMLQMAAVSVKKEFDLIPEIQSLSKSPGLEAAVILWQHNQQLPVELAWWRSPFRSTRLLVVSLYYSKYTDRDLDFFPQFKKEAERFEPTERAARLEEILYVEKNITLIKQKIKIISINKAR